MNRRKLQRRTALAQVIAARWEIVRLAPAIVDSVFGARLTSAELHRYGVQCVELEHRCRTVEGITA